MERLVAASVLTCKAGDDRLAAEAIPSIPLVEDLAADDAWFSGVAGGSLLWSARHVCRTGRRPHPSALSVLHRSTAACRLPLSAKFQTFAVAPRRKDE